MKVICLLITLLMVSGIAFADQTGSSWFHSHSYTDKYDPNTDSYVDRYGEFEPERKNPLGLGVDLTVYEFDGELNKYGLDKVEVQNKWDMRNNEYSGYIVLKTNPWKLIRDLL